MDARIRPLEPKDSFEELTQMLHRSYAGLGQMGLNFTACDQDVARTRSRCCEGECWVAELAGQLVGTIALVWEPSEGDPAYYLKPGVAHFGQFGVEPALQGAGIGHALLQACERRATDLGFRELALDTAEPAQHLISYYQRMGYQIVDRHQWGDKTYTSVIMARPLCATMPA